MRALPVGRARRSPSYRGGADRSIGTSADRPRSADAGARIPVRNGRPSHTNSVASRFPLATGTPKRRDGHRCVHRSRRAARIRAGGRTCRSVSIGRCCERIGPVYLPRHRPRPAHRASGGVRAEPLGGDPPLACVAQRVGPVPKSWVLRRHNLPPSPNETGTFDPLPLYGNASSSSVRRMTEPCSLGCPSFDGHPSAGRVLGAGGLSVV